MKKAMIKKVTAFLIAGTMLIIVVPSHNKVTAEAKVNSINYDFLNNEPGMASGKITVSTTTPGDYQLYWADDKGKPQEIIKINKTKITKIGKSKKISKKSKKYKTQINYKKIPNAYKYEIQYGNDKKRARTRSEETKTKLGDHTWRKNLLSSGRERSPGTGDERISDSV